MQEEEIYNFLKEILGSKFIGGGQGKVTVTYFYFKNVLLWTFDLSDLELEVSFPLGNIFYFFRLKRLSYFYSRFLSLPPFFSLRNPLANTLPDRLIKTKLRLKNAFLMTNKLKRKLPTIEMLLRAKFFRKILSFDFSLGPW